jgi:hypothetical protein
VRDEPPVPGVPCDRRRDFRRGLAPMSPGGKGPRPHRALQNAETAERWPRRRRPRIGFVLQKWSLSRCRRRNRQRKRCSGHIGESCNFTSAFTNDTSVRRSGRGVEAGGIGKAAVSFRRSALTRMASQQSRRPLFVRDSPVPSPCGRPATPAMCRDASSRGRVQARRGHDCRRQASRP